MRRRLSSRSVAVISIFLLFSFATLLSKWIGYSQSLVTRVGDKLENSMRFGENNTYVEVSGPFVETSCVF